MPLPQPDIRRRRGSGLRFALLLLSVAATLGMTAPHQPDPNRGDLDVMRADGTLAHDNSRDGAAILSASNVWPGWSGSGDVTITNSGTGASWLRLAAADVQDLPGAGGGRLSERLALTVDDVTVPDFPVPVYSGPVGGLAERWLGRMEPGGARSYRFVTTMPTDGADNAYQASATDVRFEWTVSHAAPDAGPPDDTPPPEDPPIIVVPDGDPVVIVNRGRLNLRLAIPPTQRPLRKRSLLAYGACSRACRAKFSGRLTVLGGKNAGVVTVSRALSAGIRTGVRMRLSRRTVRTAKRALRRGRSVRGTVVFSGRDRAGRTARVAQRIRLVPARRR